MTSCKWSFHCCIFFQVITDYTIRTSSILSSMHKITWTLFLKFHILFETYQWFVSSSMHKLTLILFLKFHIVTFNLKHTSDLSHHQYTISWILLYIFAFYTNNVIIIVMETGLQLIDQLKNCVSMTINKHLFWLILKQWFSTTLIFSKDFLGRTEIRVKEILTENSEKRGPIIKRLLLHEVECGEVIIKLDLQLYNKWCHKPLKNFCLWETTPRPCWQSSLLQWSTDSFH